MPLNCHMYIYLGVRMYNNIAITSKKNITYLSVRPQPCIHRRINTKKECFVCLRVKFMNCILLDEVTFCS